MKRTPFLPFEEARRFVHTLNLKTQQEWISYVKSGNKPSNIPSKGDSKYKGQWKGFGDWLGTGRIADQHKEFLSFEDSMEYVRSMKFKTQEDFRLYCESAKITNITTHPERRYKDQWKGWSYYLGNENKYKRELRPFEDARSFVHTLNIKNVVEWNKYCRSGNKPENIPADPKPQYLKSGWISMGDWLGTGRVADQLKVYRSFKDARDFVRTLNFKTTDEWREYCNSGKKPDDIPKSPNIVYRIKK